MMEPGRLLFRRRHGLPLLLAGGLLLVGGCTETPNALGPNRPLLSAGTEGEVMFSPQPDPPKEMFRFTIDTPELIGNPEDRDGAWEGEFVNEAGVVGVVIVEFLLPAVQHGQTLHLSQGWNFITDGTSLPAIQLDGILNLRSGRLVLNGRGADGRAVHLQGWLNVRDGGSLTGEVLFTPPDPLKPASVLAFSSTRGTGVFQIFTINSNGTGLKQLTEGRSDKIQPAWSPDGSKIAFARSSEEGGTLYSIVVMNANGSGAQVLVSDASWSFTQPAWSPDGKYIALSQVMQGTAPHLAWTRADGSSPPYAQLLEEPIECEDEVAAFCGTGIPGEHPSWAPGGNRLAFRDWSADNLPQVRVLDIVVDQEWLYMCCVVPLTGNTHLSETEPAFSPGGSTIAHTVAVFRRAPASRSS